MGGDGGGNMMCMWEIVCGGVGVGLIAAAVWCDGCK